MRIIFLGAPGAGKGTQASAVALKFGIPIISTGNILKAEIKAGTELGLKAQSFINAGALVPDATVIDIVAQTLRSPQCRDGFLLDGFPRTIAQAQALETLGIDIDFVADIDVSDDVIVKRVGGRLSCFDCGQVFHIAHNPPKAAGICDFCGAALRQRDDDAPETVLKRLEVYHAQTEPLIEFYREKGVLVSVDGALPSETVTREILRALHYDKD